jgi:hypothetical protein
MTRKVDTLAALALLQTTAMAAWLWTWWPRDEGSADALAQRVAVRFQLVMSYRADKLAFNEANVWVCRCNRR